MASKSLLPDNDPDLDPESLGEEALSPPELKGTTGSKVVGKRLLYSVSVCQPEHFPFRLIRL